MTEARPITFVQYPGTPIGDLPFAPEPVAVYGPQIHQIAASQVPDLAEDASLSDVIGAFNALKNSLVNWGSGDNGESAP